MFSKDKTVLLRLTTFFLFLLLVWTVLLTAFNLWVYIGPPTANPQFYRTRAETFFGVSIFCWSLSWGLYGASFATRSTSTVNE